MLTPELHEFKISLENYYGPLDLLLHLAKQNEVDILNIPLSKVVDDYIYFIDVIKNLDINIAGDFFSIATQLMILKSRRILPSDQQAEGEEEDGSSFNLIKKLLEYKRFKESSEQIKVFMRRRELQYERPPYKIETKVTLKNINTFEIASCFAKIVTSTQFKSKLDIIYQEIPIEEFIGMIVELISKNKNITFDEVLRQATPGHRRYFAVGTLLALLELVKQQKVSIEQEESGNITISSIE